MVAVQTRNARALRKDVLLELLLVRLVWSKASD